VCMPMTRPFELASRSNEDDLRFAVRCVGEDISASRDTRCGRVPASVQSRQRLARESENSRSVAQLNDIPVSFHDLVGVAGPERNEPRNGAQGRQVLNRLVCWAVLAVAHGIVREDEEVGSSMRAESRMAGRA